MKSFLVMHGLNRKLIFLFLLPLKIRLMKKQ